MGIRFFCPNGHKLNVKSFLAGKRGFCPHCNASVDIPLESTRDSSKKGEKEDAAPLSVPVTGPAPGSTAASPANAPVAQPAPLAQPVSQPTGMAPMAQPAQPQMGTPQPAPAQQFQANSMQPAAQPAAMPIQTTTTQPMPPQPMAPQPAAATDPIDEAPTAVWYVRPSGGGQYGPATGDIMRQWITEGRVAPDSLVWREGWPNWQSAAQTFPNLRPSSGLFSGPAY